MRTFLTMLGIVIGISSVILLMSIGASAEKLIIGQVQGVGSNLVFVIPGASKGTRFSPPASSQGIIIKTLTSSDVDALKRDPAIMEVAPEVRGQAKAVFGNNDTSAMYIGVTENFFTTRNFVIEKGQGFNSSDVDSFNRIAVIGPEISKTLFGDFNPIGKNFRLNDISFRVSGVLEKKGVGAFGVDQDNTILVPISVAQKQMLGIDYFNAITVQVNDTYASEYTKSRVFSIMRSSHRITDPNKDDFTVHTQEDILSLLGSITSVLTIFLTSIACISLVVGGIGIMNIMLVSVIERTREIGLRKAVGATNGDILQQFLWEAVMLTFFGGFIGILFGSALVGGAYLILVKIVKTDWVFALPAQAIILAVVVSTCTGVLFGLYPARQAAKKDPIDALRYE
ncbi:MAG: ABC transporter permease [Candidatus Paceibacterota bacterium]